MFWKAQRKLRNRLAKITAIASVKSNPETEQSSTNSFLSAIAEHEQAQSAIAEARLSPPLLEVEKATVGNPNSHPVPKEPAASAAENAQSVADSFVATVANSKTYTIGFVTLGSTKHSGFAGYEIVRRLARETQRQAIYLSMHHSTSIFRACIQTLDFEVYGKRNGVRQAADVVIDDRITLDSWHGDNTSPNTFAMIQKSIVEMPNLKRRFRIIAIDLGKADSPIAAPIGRMCDSVTLLVPPLQTLKPHDASRAVAHLESAGVRFAGSIALSAAA